MPCSEWYNDSGSRYRPVDGGAVAAISRINAFVFAASRYGLNVDGGDLEADGFDEIVCGAGPDPAFGSRIQGYQYDDRAL